MSGTAIVTDSTADIPGELLKKYDITLVPLSVIFGNQSFKEDGKEITPAQFYDKLKQSRVLPKSAQPSPGDFFETYSRLIQDHDSVVSIHISKKMSGTIDSALMAQKRMNDDRIKIIDSELVHMPLGFLVLYATQMAQQGKDSSKIVEGVNELKQRMNSLFIPNTLEYLQKGGRIGRARSLIASVLEIKPILTLKFGEVSQFKTTRRWRQAKNELINSMAAMVKEPSRLIVSVADSDTFSEGEEMKQKIEEAFHPQQILRVSFGCVLGTHLGPGALGITFYEN